jgi:predicted pyridoxine 5'-phosphate oxidase superfamily flavin-nucleotide-binding protein
MSHHLSPTISEALHTAEAKALATSGPGGINVVPVSMIKVNDDSIWLFDFFMDKSAKNVELSPQVALTAWSGMKGVQIKGTAEYLTSGPDFEEAVRFVASENPSRVVKGLIILSPTEIFDISPGGAFSATDLAL